MADEKCSAVKSYLQKIRLYDTHINNKIAELSRLKGMVTNITPTLKDDVVSGSGSKDKLGDTVAKIVDLQDEINKAIDEFVDKKNEVCAIIDSLQNPDHVALLHKRYVEYLTWEQIACEMHMSYRNVCYIHGRALQAASAVLNKKFAQDCIDLQY